MKKYTVTAEITVTNEIPDDQVLIMLNTIPDRGIQSLPWSVARNMHLDCVTVGYEMAFASDAEYKQMISEKVARMRRDMKIDTVIEFLKDLDVLTDELTITLEKKKCT